MSRIIDAKDPGFEREIDALMADRRQVSCAVDFAVGTIVDRVRNEGDAALIDLTASLDGVELHSPAAFVLDRDRMVDAQARLSSESLDALNFAADRIRRFHASQKPDDFECREAEGLACGWRWNPIDAVGVYTPGGTAPYPSSVLMTAIPAQVAGVARIVMVTPPSREGVASEILAAAGIAGVERVYSIGGAQAIAALAYGTQTVAPVDKIVGPGNAYVAAAKLRVASQVGVDMFAGPSEVMILADGSVPEQWTAMDLLAQAEHDVLAQAILVTTCPDYAHRVLNAVDACLPELPRHEIAGQAWQDHGRVIVVADWEAACGIANRFAPEHLQLAMVDADRWIGAIRRAGAVFVGAFAPEAIGDYVAGPSHVLPTAGSARFASPLSVEDFMTRTSTIRLNADGMQQLGPAARQLAKMEALHAHQRSVDLRLADCPPGRRDG